MKQKSGQFAMLIVNHLTNVNVSEILSLNMSNMKKLKKHSLNQKPWGKFVFHVANKNRTDCESNRESLHKRGGKNMVKFYFNINLPLEKHNLAGIWNVN